MEVRNKALPVPGVLEIPSISCSSGRNMGTEEAIGFWVCYDTTVIDDTFGGGLDGVVSCPPRIKWESCTHEDFAMFVQWFVGNHFSNKGRAGR